VCQPAQPDCVPGLLWNGVRDANKSYDVIHADTGDYTMHFFRVPSAWVPAGAGPQQPLPMKGEVLDLAASILVHGEAQELLQPAADDDDFLFMMDTKELEDLKHRGEAQLSHGKREESTG
jgi:hypothetical protein